MASFVNQENMLAASLKLIIFIYQSVLTSTSAQKLVLNRLSLKTFPMVSIEPESSVSKSTQDKREVVILNKKPRDLDKDGFAASDMRKDDGNDMKDDQFAEYDEMSNDVADSMPNKDQLEDLISSIKKDFEMPELNMIKEIRRCEQFAKDADEFMKISGEDNIFRSSCDWLVPPSDDPAKERTKMVRAAIDSILMSIFNAQTEIQKTRTTADSMEYKYKIFSGWILDELRYIEMQICQVSQEIMKLLQANTKTVKVSAKVHLRVKQDKKTGQEKITEIPNYFWEYAQDKAGNNLTYEDLLEYLKRCVFKAACSISAYNQTAHENLKALDAYLLELEYPVKDEDK